MPVLSQGQIESMQGELNAAKQQNVELHKEIQGLREQNAQLAQEANACRETLCRVQQAAQQQQASEPGQADAPDGINSKTWVTVRRADVLKQRDENIQLRQQVEALTEDVRRRIAWTDELVKEKAELVNSIRKLNHVNQKHMEERDAHAAVSSRRLEEITALKEAHHSAEVACAQWVKLAEQHSAEIGGLRTAVATLKREKQHLINSPIENGQNAMPAAAGVRPGDIVEYVLTVDDSLACGNEEDAGATCPAMVVHSCAGVANLVVFISTGTLGRIGRPYSSDCKRGTWHKRA